jgi:N-methylhydantoinase B
VYAAANNVWFQRDGQRWVPEMRSKAEKVPLEAGDSVHLASPGGGGYGGPSKRDIRAVERDLNLGFIDRGTAERIYGATVEETGILHDKKRFGREESSV